MGVDVAVDVVGAAVILGTIVAAAVDGMAAADVAGAAAVDVVGSAGDVVGAAAVEVVGAAVDVVGSSVDVVAVQHPFPFAHGNSGGAQQIPQPIWLAVNGLSVTDARELDAVKAPSSYRLALPPPTTMQACRHFPFMMGLGESQMPGRSS